MKQPGITQRKQDEETLRLQHAALEAAANAIVFTDPSGNVLWVNAAFTALTGYTAQDILGKNPRLLKSGQQDEAFYRNLWQTISVGQVWRGELTNRRKDGSLYEEEMTITPLRNAEGGITRYIAIKQDISGRERAEEAMQESKQIMDEIINTIPVRVFWKDKNLVYLGCNAAFARDAGFANPKDIIGKNDNQMGWRAQAEKYRGDDRQVIESGCSKLLIEEPQTTPEGDIITLLSSKIPLRNSKGEISGVIGTYLDITTRKQTENALRASEEKFRSLFESSRDAIMTMEPPSWRFTSGNPAAVKMLGAKNEEEFILHGIGDLSPDLQPDGRTSAGKAKEIIETILREGSHFFEWTYRRLGGEEFRADVLVTRMEQVGKVILQGTVRDITERKRAQVELESLHQQLMESSRLAGMSEIATNVLHNVGNALNSVNISTDLIVDCVKNSKASSLARVVLLLQEHAHDLGPFLTKDPNGRHVPVHLARLSEHLMAEEAKIAGELDSLRRNVEHIKEIVAMQQNYATVGGVNEMTDLAGLVEDSLRLNEGGLNRHGVKIVRELEKAPPMNVEKHKILQILVNLVRNAKYACDDSARADKRLTVRLANGDGRVKISVLDNGVGIPPENLTRIFNYGFTTRKGGHGFGLHGSALAAREMGGSLTVCSGGHGQGAAFTLELPCPAPEKTHE
jgi:PAS domain S-box-containing protein